MMIYQGNPDKLAIFTNIKLSECKEWIFFGGSFNPWHQGHTSCLDLLWKQKKKEAIVIPDHSPHKEKRNISNPKKYCQQLAETITKQTDTPFSIYGDFLSLEDKNPSYRWIAELKEKHPEQELSLLIGNDSFISLDSWLQWEDLLAKLSTLYVVNRENNSRETQKKWQLYLDTNPNLKTEFLGPHPFEHLSSSSLRRTST